LNVAGVVEGNVAAAALRVAQTLLTTAFEKKCEDGCYRC
jgi:hypothetical protein